VGLLGDEFIKRSFLGCVPRRVYDAPRVLVREFMLEIFCIQIISGIWLKNAVDRVISTATETQ